MSEILPWVTALLTVALVLNLALTLRLARIVLGLQQALTPPALAAGTLLPDLSGRSLLDGQRVTTSSLGGTASVLVFFSPDCPLCHTKVAELDAIRRAMGEAGVALWVVISGGKRRARAFLGGTSLLQHAVVLRPRALQELNPRQSSPFYVFSDHERRVQASSFVGDENWQSFMSQMKTLQQEAA